MIPTICHSGKGKTEVTVKVLIVAKVSAEKGQRLMRRGDEHILYETVRMNIML